jgi:crotonobetainyl-CoA:carnitine CoA-transferase CaiB-like acyl-CoA transferase
VNRDDLAREQFSPPPRQDEIIGELQAIFLGKTRAEWIKSFDPNLVCYAPVNSMEEAFEDPQIRHRRSWFKEIDPEEGQVPQPGFSLKFSEDQPGWRTPAPGIGEHTHSILGELGIGENELQELKAAGII